MCDQQRLRSAFASMQSDQSLHWSDDPSTASRLSKEGKTRTLAILGGCMIMKTLCYCQIWSFYLHVHLTLHNVSRSCANLRVSVVTSQDTWLLVCHCIYPKYWDILPTYHICPKKIWKSLFYYLLMCLKYCHIYHECRYPRASTLCNPSLSKAVLTAPWECSTCPYQQSLLSFRMRYRSSNAKMGK